MPNVSESSAEIVIDSADAADLVVGGYSGVPSGSAGGVTDHGLLTGLADDDHPQYVRHTEGDATYEAKGAAAAGDAAHTAADDPHDQYLKVGEADPAGTAALLDAAHVTAGEHTQYAVTDHVHATIDPSRPYLSGGTTGVPTAGHLVVENTGGTTRLFRVHKTDADALPYDLTMLMVGDLVTLLREPNDPGIFARYYLTSEVVDQVTYWEFDTNRTDSSGPTPAPAETLMRFVPSFAAGPPSSGVTDHGALGGLGDDDHLQYHTDARGDARYSQTTHGHTGLLPPGGVVGDLPVKTAPQDGVVGWQAGTQVFVDPVEPPSGSGQRVGDLWVAASAQAAASLLLGGAAPAAAVDRVVYPGDSIQAAIDVGPGSVILAAGDHAVTAPIRIGNEVNLSGVGRATKVRASVAVESIIECKGDIIGWQINNLMIDAPNAEYGVNVAVDFSGSSVDSEPDTIARIDRLWVYDAQDIGLRFGATPQSDVQNMITSRCRVRRAGNFGVWIGDGANVAAADNMFAFIDATTANPGGAGFFVGTANCHFTACKAWYCRGYGWHVKGTRNTFAQCESQDTTDHGWYLEWGKNVLNGCVADSAAYYDVGGVPNGADGFYVVDGSNMLVGCNSFDRQQGAPSQQRYGYNVPESMTDPLDATHPAIGSHFVGNTGYQNLTALYNFR